MIGPLTESGHTLQQAARVLIDTRGMPPDTGLAAYLLTESYRTRTDPLALAAAQAILLCSDRQTKKQAPRPWWRIW